MTALDVVVLLGLQRAGMRRLEAFIVALVLTVGGCLAIECWLAASTWRSLGDALSLRLDADSLYVAVAILGATVMPHNLYLHSSLVPTRVAPTTSQARRRALLAAVAAAVIIACNAWLVVTTLSTGLGIATFAWVAALGAAALALLAYVAIVPLRVNAIEEFSFDRASSDGRSPQYHPL